MSEAANPPCGEGLARVELGFPLRGGPTASFTTTGGDLYVTARRFEHGGPFDPAPGEGSTLGFFGPQERQPSYDEQRNVVTNVLVETRVLENRFSKFELPAGRYWAWTSNGGDLVVVSCARDGVSDAVPFTAQPA